MAHNFRKDRLYKLRCSMGLQNRERRFVRRLCFVCKQATVSSLVNVTVQQAAIVGLLRRCTWTTELI